MKEYQSLSHTRWDCKYHVVFIPKRRKKLLFGKLRKYLGEVLHDLANQKESVIVEGHLMLDHIHMCISRAYSEIKRSDMRSQVRIPV
jgi:putative transposase